MGIAIIGTGGYVPDRIVTNEEICTLVPDTTPDWILNRAGIATRRYAAPEQATSDLVAIAATRALEAAGLAAADLDYIVVATSTGDSPLPPVSCLVQDQIGARNAACFDVNVVCPGFVFGLEIARSLVSANPGTRVLVAGADLYSRFLDYRDRRTCVLFGDGAGAAIVADVPGEAGILATHLSSYGDAHDLIEIVGGGSRFPPSASTIAEGKHYVTMRGRDVRDFVLDNMPALLDKVLSRAGVAREDVDCFIPHQANGVLIDELAARCGLEDAHKHRNVQSFGNLGAASVPVVLDGAVRNGLIGPGDLVLLAAFGAGMAAGVCLMRWGTS